MNKILKRIFSAVISFALAVFVAAVGGIPTAVFACAEDRTAYEQTSVLDDLTGATIDGKSFLESDYPPNSKGETRLLSLVEYAYSEEGTRQGNYGLYAYLYNPKRLEIEWQSQLNTVQFCVNNKSYTKYPLEFLSEDKGGLFYKCKVVLADEQKQSILSELDSENRIYRVSGIELLTKGDLNATEYAVGRAYHFSGYAKGYGASGENMLKSYSEQSEVLPLKVHPTQYRPTGTNGKNDYTQDSLHSVYFAVPNGVMQEYDGMSAVHATWRNAVLKPALVTGNQKAYNAILANLGKNIGKETDAFDYGYLGGYVQGVSGTTGALQARTQAGFSYNRDFQPNRQVYGYPIETLYMLFNSGDKVDSADTYTVASEEVIEQMKGSKANYGGVILNGKYSSKIFESYDEQFTEVNLRADENFTLTSEKISKSWWDMLFKTSGKVVSTTFDGIQAIYPVTVSDMQGTAKQVADRLYIGESDYKEFSSFYEKHKTDSTVYLFRYQVSDYISQEATLFSRGSFLWLDTWEEVDTNAYFFQETVNLDFDVIDVTLSKGMTETIIPVVASPIDIVPAPTPPVNTISDKNPNWWILLAVILAIILLSALSPILTPIFKFLIWLICLPFKGIKKLCRRKRDEDD